MKMDTGTISTRSPDHLMGISISDLSSTQVFKWSAEDEAIIEDHIRTLYEAQGKKVGTHEPVEDLIRKLGFDIYRGKKTKDGKDLEEILVKKTQNKLYSHGRKVRFEPLNSTILSQIQGIKGPQDDLATTTTTKRRSRRLRNLEVEEVGSDPGPTTIRMARDGSAEALDQNPSSPKIIISVENHYTSASEHSSNLNERSRTRCPGSSSLSDLTPNRTPKIQSPRTPEKAEKTTAPTKRVHSDSNHKKKSHTKDHQSSSFSKQPADSLVSTTNNTKGIKIDVPGLASSLMSKAVNTTVNTTKLFSIPKINLSGPSKNVSEKEEEMRKKRARAEANRKFLEENPEPSTSSDSEGYEDWDKRDNINYVPTFEQGGNGNRNQEIDRVGEGEGEGDWEDEREIESEPRRRRPGRWRKESVSSNESTSTITADSTTAQIDLHTQPQTEKENMLMYHRATNSSKSARDATVRTSRTLKGQKAKSSHIGAYVESVTESTSSPIDIVHHHDTTTDEESYMLDGGNPWLEEEAGPKKRAQDTKSVTGNCEQAEKGERDLSNQHSPSKIRHVVSTQHHRKDKVRMSGALSESGRRKEYKTFFTNDHIHDVDDDDDDYDNQTLSITQSRGRHHHKVKAKVSLTDMNNLLSSIHQAVSLGLNQLEEKYNTKIEDFRVKFQKEFHQDCEVLVKSISNKVEKDIGKKMLRKEAEREKRLRTGGITMTAGGGAKKNVVVDEEKMKR